MTEAYRNPAAVSKQDAQVQLLVFKLDDQEYALDVAHVVQVIRMVAMTRPPQAPDYVEGLFNLRGQVVQVVDLRKRCGLPAKHHDLNTQLLITRSQDKTMAFMVDLVLEVLTLPAGSIEATSRVGQKMDYLAGVGKLGDRLLLLLDPHTFSAA